MLWLALFGQNLLNAYLKISELKYDISIYLLSTVSDRCHNWQGLASASDIFVLRRDHGLLHFKHTKAAGSWHFKEITCKISDLEESAGW